MRAIPLLARDNVTVRAYTYVDDTDYERLAEHIWRLHSKGYACRAAATILMHREIMDAPPELEVDHRNGNKLWNVRSNLRLATVSQNGHNRTRLNGNNKSGYRGVSWLADRGKWRAKTKLDGRDVHLGYFDTPEAAAEAFVAWQTQQQEDYSHGDRGIRAGDRAGR